MTKIEESIKAKAEEFIHTRAKLAHDGKLLPFLVEFLSDFRNEVIGECITTIDAHIHVDNATFNDGLIQASETRFLLERDVESYRNTIRSIKKAAL